MNQKTSSKIVSYALVASFLLTGCGKQSECEIPSSHVHLYTKGITSGITIKRYLADEHLNIHGYNWNEEYIEITKADEQLYNIIEKYGLFEGTTNWDYLYYQMANHHDYLSFYYEYYTYEVRTRTDSEGRTETYTERVRHDGWHNDPKDSDNTGKTRLYHHRYYGYRIVYKNGKYVAERSPLVDDIRDIIYDYPYFTEDCVEEVYTEYRFKPRELKDLKPEDFNDFEHPDLENKELESPKVRTK